MQRSNQQRENERNENSIEEPASSNDNAVVSESGEIPAAEKAETIPAVEKKEFKVIEINETTPLASENKEEAAQPKKRV